MKSLFKKLNSLAGKKIRNGLHITEMQARLDEINHRAFLLQQEVEKLEKVIGVTNVILSGNNTSTHPLHDQSHGGSGEIYDIADVISNRLDDTITINVILKYIEKTLSIKKSSFALVGSAGNMLLHILEKKGAKKIIDVRCQSLNGHKNSSQKLMAYPLELHTIQLTKTDILIFPQNTIGSIALNHSMFGFGIKTHSAVFLVAQVMNDSIFSNEIKEKAYVVNSRLVYNDNYVRQQIHSAGFSEVSCIYTSGENINHTFDEKISHFSYKSSTESTPEVIKNNLSYATIKAYNAHQPVEKIYCGTKLPTIIE